MILPEGAIEALCAASPGLEAWLLEDADEGGGGAPPLRHLGKPERATA